MATLTITSAHGLTVTIPDKVHTQREDNCKDLIIGMQIEVGLPICVEVSLRTDGTFKFWNVVYDGRHNSYGHIVHGMNGSVNDRDVLPKPTEAQRCAIGSWYLGNKPLGLPGSPGRDLIDWALPGMSAHDISNNYGDGSAIYVA